MKQISEEQKLMNAYYAGFNQSHYSNLHPDVCPPKNMIEAAVEWYRKEYGKTIIVHHSGIVLEKEGDDII